MNMKMKLFLVGVFAAMSMTAQAGNGGLGAESQAGATAIVITEGTVIPEKTEQEVRSAPSMIAPSLTTTMTETCMGSTSTGISGMGFGVSFGTTWRDTSCVRRLDAREIKSLGDAQAAKELLCIGNANVRAAFEAVGRPCVSKDPE